MFELRRLSKHGTTTLALLLALVLATGCAGTEPGSPRAVYEQQVKKEEAHVEAVEESVEEIPDWYTNPPKDDHSFYTAGTATSSELQFALDKAVLGAKRAMADQINSLISSKMKVFLAEVGVAEDAEVVTEAEHVTSNVITEVSVAGYSQEESKFVAQGGKYRAYVLLRYPVGKANRTLVEQVKKSKVLEGKLRASKAFRDLEEEIKRARGPGSDESAPAP